MNRRKLLAVTGSSLALGISGCLGEGQGPTAQEKEHPIPPEQLYPDSVVNFVKEYEGVEFYNQILSAEQNTEAISLTCNANLDRETESGFYVLTQCGGSATLQDGHAEYPPMAYGITIYRITENRTVQRVNTPMEAGATGYYILLVNFDGIGHEVSIAMTSSSKSSDNAVYDESHNLGNEAASGQWVESTEVPEYELILGLDGKEEETFVGSTSQSVGIGIYLTADRTEIGPISSIP